MNFGVIFPQCEIGSDPETIRAYAKTAEEVGYSQLYAYDHVLGVDPTNRPGFDGPYDYEDPFYEPLALFSHLGAVTTDIELITGVLILPQRQTALVAKQAATIDVLTDGRLTLGVGVGWNEAEYMALGADFRIRGARVDEQLEVLRELWTNDVVDYDGQFHQLPAVGINPRPAQQPIPIWIGGGAERVLERAGRRGDGWLVPSRWKHPDTSLDGFEQSLQTVHEHRRTGPRAEDEFAVVARTTLGSDDPDRWVERIREWKQAGATHLAVSTMGAGLTTPSDHIATIRRYKAAVDDADLEVE